MTILAKNLKMLIPIISGCEITDVLEVNIAIKTQITLFGNAVVGIRKMTENGQLHRRKTITGTRRTESFGWKRIEAGCEKSLQIVFHSQRASR
jgi:hypothetical protein